MASWSASLCTSAVISHWLRTQFGELQKIEWRSDGVGLHSRCFTVYKMFFSKWLNFRFWTPIEVDRERIYFLKEKINSQRWSKLQCTAFRKAETKTRSQVFWVCLSSPLFCFKLINFSTPESTKSMPSFTSHWELWDELYHSHREKNITAKHIRVKHQLQKGSHYKHLDY